MGVSSVKWYRGFRKVAVLLLDIYTRKRSLYMYQKWMHPASLFVMAPTWRPPESSTLEWIHQLLHNPTLEYYKNKNQTQPLHRTAWMNLTIYWTNKPDTQAYTVFDFSHVKFKLRQNWYIFEVRRMITLGEEGAAMRRGYQRTGEGANGGQGAGNDLCIAFNDGSIMCGLFYVFVVFQF